MTPEVIRRLPKTDLHVHLDGSLRLGTLIDLARRRGVDLPSYTEAGLRELVFRPSYANLGEYLEGFQYTVAVLQDHEALEQTTFELCEDCQAEGVRYVEIRFAPQLHVGPGLDFSGAVRAVDAGIRRAAAAFNARPEIASGREPRFVAGIILCALRAFTPDSLRRLPPDLRGPARGVAAGSCTRRPASRWRARPRGSSTTRGCSSSASTWPDRRRGTRPRSTAWPTRWRTRRSWARPFTRARTTVPSRSSRRSATCTPIGSATGRGCSTSRRSPARRITDRTAYVERLAQFIADKRITIEVCLTSNQQTVPELGADLSQHPFREMRKRRLSTTLCTDNRLVSNTTVSNEIQRAVEAFGLTDRELLDILLYGFKRSFFPEPTSRSVRMFARRSISPIR